MADKKKAKFVVVVKQALPHIDDDWVEMLVGELVENAANIHAANDIQRLCQDTVESIELKKEHLTNLFKKLEEAKLVTGLQEENLRRITFLRCSCFNFFD